jgi:hypothetical protein
MGSGKPKKAHSGNGRLIANAIVLLTAIIAMGISTFAWFTTKNPGANEIVLTSGDSQVTVDAYAYTPGYTTDTNGDPVATAYYKNDGTLLNVTSVAGTSGKGSVQVTFSKEALSSFNYNSLYGDELYQKESSYPHLYVELRYTKPANDGFVKATVSDIAYAGAITSSGTTYTNITSSLGYEYRTITEQNTSTGTKYRNGFTATNNDTNFQATAWTTLNNGAADFSLYNNTTDVAGYAYGGSYTVENQCYVPGYAYKYDDTNYYYSKSTFLEVRVNPLSWLSYFRSNPSANAGLFNFGITFNIGLDFSNQPYYDNGSSTLPRLSLSTALVNMQPSSSDSTVSIRAYNFTGTPTYSVTSSNSAVCIGSVSGTTLTLTSYTTSATVTITVTGTSGTETASANLAVRVSGPTLVLSASSLSVKLGSNGLISADAYNFSGTVTISAASSSTAVASVTVSGSTITVVPATMGETTITVTATDGTNSRTATCAVTVTAGDKTLSSITMTTQPDTLVYTQGDTLDTTGAVVTATWSDSSTTVVTSNCSFSPTDLTTTGTVTITVSYGGKTTSFTVTVNPNTSESTYTLITTAAELSAGSRYIIATSNVAGSAYAMSTTQNSNNRGQTDVTVSSSLKITATSNIEQITLGGESGAWTLQTSTNSYLTSASNTSNYLRSNSSSALWTIVFASGVPTLTCTQGSGGTVYSHNILQYNSTSSLFACYASASQRDVYLYKEDAVTRSLSSIAITSNLTTTTYTVGQAFNTAGLGITASYTDGTDAVVTPTSITPANGSILTASGSQTVTVSYTEGGITKTATTTITVNPRTLSSIAVTTQPGTTTYYTGQSLNTTGLVVTAYYDNSTSAVVTSACTLSPANGSVLNTAGTVTVNVSYTENSVEKTTTFQVTVIQKALSSIAVTTQLTTTSYALGAAFSTAGMAITATYNDGSSAVVTGWTTNPANGAILTSAGTKTVTITYTEGGVTKTATTTITVANMTLTVSANTLTMTPNGSDSTITVTASGYYSSVTYTVTSSDDNIATGNVESGHLALLSGTAGTATITITATDAGGNTANATVTVTVSSSSSPYGTYSLATSLTPITAGSYVLFVSASAAGSAFAAGTLSSGYLTSNAVTISASSTITVTSTNSYKAFQIGGSSGAWTFKDTSNNNYIGTTTNKKIIESTTAGGDGYTWTVALDATSPRFDIASVALSTSKLKYNSTNPRFTTYSSGSTTAIYEVCLFVKAA